MKEEEMKHIGNWMADVIQAVKSYDMPDDKEERKRVIATFKKEVTEISRLKEIREEIRELTKKFPLYPDLSY